jgi:hypothetical protein
MDHVRAPREQHRNAVCLRVGLGDGAVDDGRAGRDAGTVDSVVSM